MSSSLPINRQLADRRRALGKTCQQIGDCLGVSAAKVAAWERMGARVPATDLGNWALALGLELQLVPVAQ